MYKKLRRLAGRFLLKRGYRIVPAKYNPYHYLLEVPRYTRMTVPLLGRNFLISDPVAFYWSYVEIFQEEIYRFTPDTESPVIIDCGANFGLASLYLSRKFPGAQILAVEPDPEIFAILAANVKEYGLENVRLINAAVSGQSGKMTFYCEGSDSGTLVPVDSCRQTIEVDCVTLDSLLTQKTDFLKVDIEGAETDVFLASRKLQEVGRMFIEYHSFRGRRQTLDSLLAHVKGFGFRYYLATLKIPSRPLEVQSSRDSMDHQINIFLKREEDSPGDD